MRGWSPKRGRGCLRLKPIQGKEQAPGTLTELLNPAVPGTLQLTKTVNLLFSFPLSKFGLYFLSLATKRVMANRVEKEKRYNQDSQRQSEDEAGCCVNSRTQPFSFCSLDHRRWETGAKPRLTGLCLHPGAPLCDQ